MPQPSQPSPQPGDDPALPVPPDAPASDLNSQPVQLSFERLIENVIAGSVADRALLKKAWIGIYDMTDQEAALKLIERSFPRPQSFTPALADLALFLSDMAAPSFPTIAENFIKLGEYVAQCCDDIPMQRTVKIRRAENAYEQSTSESCELTIQLLEEAIELEPEVTTKNCWQLLRCYTMLGKAYLALNCGSIELSVEEAQVGVERCLAVGKAQISQLLKDAPLDRAGDLRLVVDASLFIVEIHDESGAFEKAFDRCQGLLDSIRPASIVTVHERVRVLEAYAACLAKSQAAGPNDHVRDEESPKLLRALGYLREAEALFAEHGPSLRADLLHAKVLFQKGSILYTQNRPHEAWSDLTSASKLADPLSLENCEAEALMVSIIDEIGLCETDIEEEATWDKPLDPDLGASANDDGPSAEEDPWAGDPE
ncbi:MAG: hypothetical protein J0M12_03030 [Deltaproteobacteria bacterium]|nr:hypothetical protein [Deltaproteobacteria bacterium]